MSEGSSSLNGFNEIDKPYFCLMLTSNKSEKVVTNAFKFGVNECINMPIFKIEVKRLMYKAGLN